MIAALLLLAQITPVPAEAAPVETTIAAIGAEPKKFDGQLVRLHGYVNRCQPSSCGIEEHPANAAGGPGARLSIAGDKKFDDTIKPLLPTYVEVDARVDAKCLTAACPALTVETLRGVVSPEPPPFEKP
jgi:hypothetical protein